MKALQYRTVPTIFAAFRVAPGWTKIEKKMLSVNGN